MKIAISGQMCSGKSTLANIIKDMDNEYEIFSFGKKIKEIAVDLFDMNKNDKDRTLIINIANKMKEIDNNIWIKYIIKQINKNISKKCIIDDLRFQNELDKLMEDDEWIFIRLNIDDNKRIERIKKLYPNNFKDHIKNFNDISENCNLKFPTRNTIFINSDKSLNELKQDIKYIINKKL